MTDLIKVKEMMKRKQPAFTRSDSNKKKRMSKNWRRPNGLHSKMRLSHKGFKRSVSIGYRSPVLLRNVGRDGLKKVLVKNLSELQKLDPRKNSAVIAGIGLKKKIEILKEAQKRKIKVCNVKDIQKFLDDAEKKIAERREKRAERKKEEKKGKEAKKEELKEKKKEEEPTPEEKEKLEKREKEKILIKKS